jgi:NAD-dependent deacetylase
MAANGFNGKVIMRLDPNASIVILTGAGISKESGLDTFRDEGGVWSKVRIEDVATPDAYRANPARVHEFYNMRRAGVLDDNLHPNAAHKALAELESKWPGDVLVVTQNVDDLHERGGTKNLIHMHGELLKSRCTACGDVNECRIDLSVGSVCAACGAIGTVRPHIVWFGEMPMQMDEIHDALADAGLFISIGTSGNVYPAAGFVDVVRVAGNGRTIELNLEPSEGATHFDHSNYGPATEIVPAFVQSLLKNI